jgi:hypothetical protein
MPRTSALRIAVLTDANFTDKGWGESSLHAAQFIQQNTIISPRSALGRSDDRNAIILFSTSVGLFLANSTNASGELASILLRKPISLLSYGSRVA